MSGESKGQRTRYQEAYGITGLGFREKGLGIAPQCLYSVEGGGSQTEGHQMDTQETEKLGEGTRGRNRSFRRTPWASPSLERL